MFQTEPILWLQSYSSTWLTWVMTGLSMIGQPYVYLAILLLAIFTLDFRKGIFMTNGILYTYIAVVMIKAMFALPRPYQVDASVIPLGLTLNSSVPFVGFGAQSFFGSLSSDVVAHYRSLPSPSFGFPSGHCASSVVIWGMFALLFRRRFLVILAWVIVPLVALSRMYLGMHFLGDVLGGILVGLALLGIAVLVFRVPTTRAFLAGQAYKESSAKSHLWVSAIALIVLPALLLVVSPTRTQAGTLLGLNTAMLLCLSPARAFRFAKARAVALAAAFSLVAALYFLAVSRLWNPFSETGTIIDGIQNAVFAFALLVVPTLTAWVSTKPTVRKADLDGRSI